MTEYNTKSELEYIPSDYHPTNVGNCVLWGRDGSESVAAPLFQEGITAIEFLLDYRLNRTVNVVVYASNEEARRALGRQVAATALLAPLHTSEHALVALQSPSADQRNGDQHRMRRHVCHELAHVFSAERTGSVKRLGDGDRGMRLPSWVDEGFAETVAAAATARPDIVDAAMERCSRMRMSDDAMAAAFRDLNSVDRESAFATATMRVWRAVQLRGFKFVFEHLSSPDAWECAVG